MDGALKARGVDTKVINAGIGSQCVWQGLEPGEGRLNDGALGSQTLWDEWKAKLTQQKCSGSKQRVDSIHQEKKAQLVPSVPIAEFEKHLRTLVAQLRTRTQAKVYLLTFNSVSDDYQSSQWSAELRKQQRSLYDQYRVQVLEIARGMKLRGLDVHQRFERSSETLLDPDGIHPNAKGMAVYAQGC